MMHGMHFNFGLISWILSISSEEFTDNVENKDTIYDKLGNSSLGQWKKQKRDWMTKTIAQETLRCLLIWKHQVATTDNLFIFNIINSSGDSFSVFTHMVILLS